MTHLTDLPCPPVRRGSRRGVRPPQAERNAAGGQGKPAFGGARRPTACVAALARCASIAPRTAPAQWAAVRHQMGHYQRTLV